MVAGVGRKIEILFLKILAKDIIAKRCVQRLASRGIAFSVCSITLLRNLAF